MSHRSALLAFAIAFGLAVPAASFQVAELSMKELSDLSVVEFESSFCEVVVGDTVSVMLSGAVGDAATAEIVAASIKSRNGATPNRGKQKGGDRTGEIMSVIGADGRSIDITLDAADEGWHTVHVRLELSNGDRLGVNLHSTPCEPDDGDGDPDPA